MKRNKTKIIIGGIILILLIVGTIILLNVLKDDNKLTILEKQWINNNNKIVLNMGVKNNTNVFANDGVGVFYDFITDFSNEYGLTINPNTYTGDESGEGISFRVTNELSDNDLLIYKDHYVLIGKKDVSLKNIADLANRKVGVLSRDLSHVTTFLNEINGGSFRQYDEKEKLINAFDEQEEIDYILVPLNEYLEVYLQDDNYINFHLSDIPQYYTIYINNADEKFASIVEKYYNNWTLKNFLNHYNQELFTFFTEELEVSDEQKDRLRSKTYNYGFIANAPYEVVAGSNYGGITNVLLDRFKQFASIDISYTRYKSKDALMKAINKKDIDMYFDFYNIKSDYDTIKTLFNVKYDVLVKKDNNMVINSLTSLKNERISVLEDSVLEQYLKSYDLETFKNNKELKKLTKKEKILVLDHNNYLALQNKELKNYSSRYTGVIDSTYNFAANTNSTFNRLFVKYINILDPTEVINEGLYSNEVVQKNGTLLGTIASYILYLVFGGIIIGIIIYKASKKVKIAKRIKREDKMKFIDQLTSLKNRNYLNENIDHWNKNTIYPQVAIVIDISNIQYINDTYGYEEGDKQIKAAANILIKTQLDNTDIMRTDGTEFLVYLVGYNEKQVASYMRKLTKEFKKLPYEYGAIMASSSITDDIKLLEDAINEATLAVKEKKNAMAGEENEKKI